MVETLPLGYFVQATSTIHKKMLHKQDIHSLKVLSNYLSATIAN